ncbi:MAG: isoleucine--tRNA ligase [Chloroflexota bacterium]
MFSPVSSRVSLPEMEEKVLGFWREKKIFERSVSNRRGKRRFVFFEGPPTANGSPGIHHVLSRVYKDIILRYRAMKGDYVPRIAGWDTHGLPVELEVEKQLGLTSKAQIEEYGIDRFNARCRESVFKYLKDWDDLTERIAFWLDLEHAYLTMNNDYIETVWWALKEMWDKGLIYQGYRVTPHCPRCGTSLSSHEVALGYQDNTEDPSVYIKFKINSLKLVGSEAHQSLAELFIESGKPAYLLAWTTTPWTLPANTALAVAPDADYVVVELDNEYLVIAQALLGVVGLSDSKLTGGFKGRDLEGVQYQPLYDIPYQRIEGEKEAYRVILGDFVSMEDGTGIVHIAPAYGEMDFEMGEKEGLPLIHSVDLRGIVEAFPSGYTPKYREEILKGSVMPMFGPRELPITPGAGKFVKDADKDILLDLKSRGLLFRSEKTHHTYPFCWRCGTPLIYYAKQSWYIRTTVVKDRMLAGNDQINWYPEHIKYGRFGDWLQNNVDWAVSRERYWGTPLPVWRCPACGKQECLGSIAELKARPGIDGLGEPLDLHRPYVDGVTYECPGCHGRMRRVPEVIDCWFDSGAMAIAQWHYPFENASLLEDGRFPADYISEAVDQTRGWFYSLHAISTLLFDRPGYRNVICLGLILDAKGEKMSKARGNAVKPGEVINKYGADALRWYFFTSSPPGNVRRFDEKQVAEVSRRFLMTLWNVYSFFVTYANIDRYQPSPGVPAGLSELDRWILSELNQLVLDVDESLGGYNPTEGGRRIESFVDNLSNWYVRRSRRRFWKSENDSDKMAAYGTLYHCLVTLSKLLAPYAPFIADEIYRNLVGDSGGAPESVHLADFPEANTSRIDKQLSDDVRLAMKLSSNGREARAKAGIKVRQPLANIRVVAGQHERESLARVQSQLLDELNVKAVEVVADASSLEGDGYQVSGDKTLSVFKELSPELRAEGTAREIVHCLQNMRRSAGFDIADHITTFYQGDDDFGRVMRDFADYIQQETLSLKLVRGESPSGAFVESHKIAGHQVTLGVRREDSA